MIRTWTRTQKHTLPLFLLTGEMFQHYTHIHACHIHIDNTFGLHRVCNAVSLYMSAYRLMLRLLHIFHIYTINKFTVATSVPLHTLPANKNIKNMLHYKFSCTCLHEGDACKFSTSFFHNFISAVMYTLGRTNRF